MAAEGDDLDAFFARKKKDKKKKKTVSLEDIGQQLDRKARIQEANEGQALSSLAEEERQVLEERTKLPPASNAGGGDEDSEWLDYSAKPAIPEVSFKEYQELSDDETEKGEDRGRTPETTKTWNVADDPMPTIVERTAMPEAAAKPAVYQPPGQARRSVVSAPLDISSSEMFPSIGDADELVKKEREKADERKRLAMAAAGPAITPSTVNNNDATAAVEASPEPTAPAAKTKWTPIDVPIGTAFLYSQTNWSNTHRQRTQSAGPVVLAWRLLLLLP